MADGNLGSAPIPARDEAQYLVISIEHRTPTIVEVWLQPMDYRPGEYVLLLAGAPGFIRACALAVEAHGAPRENVRTESFYAAP